MPQITLDFALSDSRTSMELARLRFIVDSAVLLSGPGQRHPSIAIDTDLPALATDPWTRTVGFLNKCPDLDLHDQKLRDGFKEGFFLDLEAILRGHDFAQAGALFSGAAGNKSPFHLTAHLQIEESRFSDVLDQLLDELSWHFYGKARIEIQNEIFPEDSPKPIATEPSFTVLATGTNRDELPGRGDMTVALRLEGSPGQLLFAQRSIERKILTALACSLPPADRATPGRRLDALEDILRRSVERPLNRLLAGEAHLELLSEDWTASTGSLNLVLVGQLPASASLPTNQECEDVLEAALTAFENILASLASHVDTLDAFPVN